MFFHKLHFAVYYSDMINNMEFDCCQFKFANPMDNFSFGFIDNETAIIGFSLAIAGAVGELGYLF